jgi:hypothetical protein
MSNVRAPAVLLIAGVVGSTSLAGAASTQAAEQPAPAAIYFQAVLAQPTTVEALVSAATDQGLDIRSVQHGNDHASGELIVGDEGFATAAGTYVETVKQNFGEAPEVLSFVSATPVGAGDLIGQTHVASVVGQEGASLDPATADSTTPDSGGDGEVGAAGVSDPWAPAFGSVWAHNSSTGSARQMRHHVTWTSRTGLNSYSDKVYEHDNKLEDPNAKMVTEVGPTYDIGRTYCDIDGFWVNSGGSTVVASNMPTGAKVYADNARGFEECGIYDVSFGIFYPAKLSVDTKYRVVVGGSAGSKSSSPQGLLGQKLSNDCQFLEDQDDCVGLNQYADGQDSTPFINRTRGWRFPGCYSWQQGQSPTSGSCP